MIDITRPHRDCYTSKFSCLWFKRNQSIFNDNQSLAYEKTGSVFWAQEVKTKQRDTEEIMGSFQMPFDNVAIRTYDNVNGINKNDKVTYNGSSWLVTSVQTNRIVDRSMFLEKLETVLYLRKM